MFDRPLQTFLVCAHVCVITLFLAIMSQNSSQGFASRNTEAETSAIGTYGRLGNRLVWLAKMLSFAARECCDVALPHDILDGWQSDKVHFNHAPRCLRNLSRGQAVCGSRTAEAWYRTNEDITECAVTTLKQYFSVNKSHVLGIECPAKQYAAFHIRSGDVVAGEYSPDTGVYTPNKGIHPKYTLYPTSYYVAVLASLNSIFDGGARFLRDHGQSYV